MKKIEQHTLLILFLCLFGTAGLMGQGFEVEIENPSVGSKCGPFLEFPVTLRNLTGQDTTDVTGRFTGRGGVFFVDAIGVDVDADENFNFGDLDSGEVVMFTAIYQIGCDIPRSNFRMEFNVEGGDAEGRSDNIEVIEADLSMLVSTPDVISAFLGAERMVTTDVVNAGFGTIAEFSYCVINNHPVLELGSLSVAGVPLPFAFTEGNKDCYTVTAEAIAAAGLGENFDNGEALNVDEEWTVINCIGDPPDIERRVQYGCQGDTDCQEKPARDFVSTGVSFDLIAPLFEAEVVSTTQPACYADEPTEVEITFTNIGTAPADGLIFRLSTGNRGMGIDLNSLMATFDGSPVMGVEFSNTMIGNSCASPNETIQVDVTISGLFVDVGETITLNYSLTTDCTCNDCDIRNKYFSSLQLREAIDLCGTSTNNFQTVTPNQRFDAFIQGLVEGPSSIVDGGTDCISYFFTNIQLDWLNDEYPDSYLEATFTIPCGLDYVPNSFTWMDRNGTVYPLNEGSGTTFTYVDNNGVGADDELRVRFLPGDRPPSFSIAGGGSFDFCVTVDCDEKPEPVCGNAIFDEVVEAQFDFTTDPNCPADCAIQKIWKPQDLPVRIICPSQDPDCECEGTNLEEFTIMRTNFGMGDSNNDQIPDGMLDVSLVQRDRFLQGDSIRAHFEGTINNPGDAREFDFGYVILPIGNSDFIPLGATLSIQRAGSTVVETCGAVPIDPDFANGVVTLDLSIQNLNALGCGFSGGDFYEDGDRFIVNFDYVEKFFLADQFRTVTYTPSVFVSEDPIDEGTRYQCNPRIARMTQVGLTANAGSTLTDFGACDESEGWSYRYDRFIGGQGLDEFNNEIRFLGLPETFVFNKPTEFIHRTDSWRVTFEQLITPRNTIHDSNTNSPAGIPAEFLVISGNQVTFAVGEYLRSLGNVEIPPDEGYRITISPRIQGNCMSLIGDYDVTAQMIESVEATIFCTPEIDRGVTTGTFSYSGAARVIVEADEELLRLCSGEEEATVRVRNVNRPDAPNSWIFPNPVGDVIVTGIRDAITGNPLTPNEFGIYELGNIPQITERVLLVTFRKNTCRQVNVNFIAGWDCNSVPQTFRDAPCRDNSRIFLASPRSAVDMLVLEPGRRSNRIVDLCEPVLFETEILSSDLGFVRDMVLSFTLPPNITYDMGTFEFAVPAADQGGTYMSVPDPEFQGNNTYRIDLSALDETLSTEGLVGSKDVTMNKVSIRFTATTECGFASGDRALFILRSKNSCGSTLAPRVRDSGRIRTRRFQPDIDFELQPVQIGFNACEPTVETLDVTTNVRGGLTGVDSVRVLLPPGLIYVQDTYVPGVNAPIGINPTVVREEDGLQVLIVPLDTELDGGNQLKFSIGLTADDIGQACADYRIRVDAFAETEEVCNGMVCQSSEIRGSAVARARVDKPSYEFTDIDGTVVLNPDDGTADADFSVTLRNTGAALPIGSTVTASIFEDINMNGTYEPAIDEFLFPLDTVITEPLGPGGSITITGQSTFTATNICTVLAVIDPEATCACSVESSPSFRPEISYEFEDEYDVCSGDDVVVGPEPVAGFNYTWLATGGSDITLLSATDVAMPTFTAPINTSGAPQIVEYIVRVSNAPCFFDEVVQITVAPLINDELSVQACMGSTFELPTVDTTGASNFSWAPAAGLTITDNGRRATIDDVMADETYVLTYDVGVGCPASLTVNVTAQDCGTANTLVGDFVWFDFDMDGVQDPDEPGIEGVTVNLINGATGTIISSTVTDANGNYIFDELPAGSYAVEVIPPPGFVFTTNDNSMDDTEDSDVDPLTGLTPPSFVPLDDANLDFDAGLVPDCTLEVELALSDCMPGDDGLVRQLTATVTWSGNPYAYDQFGDGNDTIVLMIEGRSYTLIASELEGTGVILDSLISPDVATGFSVTAAFIEATSCTAADMLMPVQPCIYDLALTKTASSINSTPPPYAYGDLVCMDFTVVNQGMQPVENVQVFDSLPEGMVFNADESDLGWSSFGELQLFIFPDRIEMGAMATATLCVNLQPSSGGPDAFTNRGEIGSFTDTLANDLSDFDEDSTPDMNFSNDPGGVPNSATDDVIDADPAVDEDDSDPFLVEIYDLALVKRIITPAPIQVGATVMYEIDVINQGNVPASDIEVTDYIPAGMTLAPTSAGIWSTPVAGPNGTMITTTDIIGPLEPGERITLTIDLIFVGVAGESSYVNVAEISDDDGDDIDSVTDQIPDNDAGGVPDSPTDDAEDGIGDGGEGPEDPLGDEDDADPALLPFEFVSLGSTVFSDANDNGIQDDDEPGIEGVTLELFLDVDGDGMLTGDELTPVATQVTGPDGAYFFNNLLPGNYQVQVPVSNFETILLGAGASSTDIATSDTDNATDGDDNGLQTEFNGLVTSPFISLAPGTEEEGEMGTNAGQEVAVGEPDANGNMTVDFGFVCSVEITGTDTRTTCSTKPVPLVNSPVIFPPELNGTYTTSGDGDFLDAAGNVLVAPFRFDEVAAYQPGPMDARNGTVTLTLTTDEPDFCPAVTETIEIVVLKVDCGSFFWDGNRP